MRLKLRDKEYELKDGFKVSIGPSSLSGNKCLYAGPLNSWPRINLVRVGTWFSVLSNITNPYSVRDWTK